MAQTTMELRHLLELTDPVTGLPFNLFDFEYEFDDVLFAGQLEQAVIDYYYFAEIGQETPARFKHVFRRRWLQMIGYYNRIHNIDLIEYDPLITYKMTETFSGENSAEQVANAKRDATLHRGGSTMVINDSTSVTAADTTTTDNNTTKTTDYPQQVIGSGYQNGESQYAGTVTNANDVTTTTGSDGTETLDTTDTTDALDVTTINDTKNDTYTKTTEGFTGRGFNSVGLVQQYMESVPRLTGQVIDELKPCFMLIY